MTVDATHHSPRLATLRRMEGAARDLEWIVSRVTPELERRSLGFGEWNVRQNLAHLLVYEAQAALPSIRLMAAGQRADTLPITADERDLQSQWEALTELDVHELHRRLRQVEEERDALAHGMTDEQFTTPLPSIWRRQSPQWVLEKSFGHTWEHGVTIFYIVHFAGL